MIQVRNTPFPITPCIKLELWYDPQITNYHDLYALYLSTQQ
jgi:hypothetical protein